MLDIRLKDYNLSNRSVRTKVCRRECKLSVLPRTAKLVMLHVISNEKENLRAEVDSLENCSIVRLFGLFDCHWCHSTFKRRSATPRIQTQQASAPVATDESIYQSSPIHQLYCFTVFLGADPRKSTAAGLKSRPKTDDENRPVRLFQKNYRHPNHRTETRDYPTVQASPMLRDHPAGNRSHGETPLTTV